MTREELEQLKVQVVLATDTASSIASVLAPQYAPLILLGAGLAKKTPDLIYDAIMLIKGGEITQADLDDFYSKVSALESPETIGLPNTVLPPTTN